MNRIQAYCESSLVEYANVLKACRYHQIEQTLGVSAMKNMLPMQPGDVHSTFADSTPLQTLIDFAPSTSLKKGVAKFVDWYLDYYGQNMLLSCVS